MASISSSQIDTFELITLQWQLKTKFMYEADIVFANRSTITFSIVPKIGLSSSIVPLLEAQYYIKMGPNNLGPASRSITIGHRQVGV